jgi:hypothetical protein
MIGDDKRRLDVRGAARIIHQTSDPTPQQVDSVRQELARGNLQGSRDGRWTTFQAVAAYLAGRASDRHDPLRGRATGSPLFLPVEWVPDARAKRPGVVRSNDTLVTLYQELLRDYVQAVLRRQKQHHRSKLFERAVVAGQFACLLVLLGIFVFGFHAVQSIRQPPEQVAVERWIAANNGDFQVLRWDTTESAEPGRGVIVRVEYQYYSPSRKRIVTSRAFEVQNDRVTEVGESDP